MDASVAAETEATRLILGAGGGTRRIGATTAETRWSEAATCEAAESILTVNCIVEYD